MSIWSEIDAYVARYKSQKKELAELAQEGSIYRMPRCVPPCMWVLRPRAGKDVPSKHFTSFSEAKAELEVDALRMRKKRAAEKAEKEAAKKAKKKR